MSYLLKNANVFIDGCFNKRNIFIDGDTVSFVDDNALFSGSKVFDLTDKYIFPGFVDVHVHFREPGFSYKETIKSGSLAAAHGGYTTVCTMPNLTPAPDCLENFNVQAEIIKKDAVINVIPYGTITKGEKGIELSDMDELANNVIAFSDDGRGVQNREIMLSAMKKAASLDKIIAAHCEENSLLRGGYIHDGKYAQEHGHKGISSESEWRQIQRDIELCKETGVKYHVCHISAKESVELIRNAKSQGINITCETAPHYLVLCDGDLQESGNFKMNPPIRDESDKLALIEGLKDGTIDMIATDHAPHSKGEKSKGLANSLMGVVGLETAFPVLYTKLVKKNIISLEKLISLMSTTPASVFGIKQSNSANLCVYDLNCEYKIDPEKFFSMGKATPFEGMNVFGKCIMTICGGKIVYKDEEQ
ncbi:MAG: dihydroorotase [Clostridiales bacterium]|nr:dihydroorotase [Clostridiales bacterium]